jgi:hypothetical protein
LLGTRERRCEIAKRTDDAGAAIAQLVLERDGDEEFVLDHQDAQTHKALLAETRHDRRLLVYRSWRPGAAERQRDPAGKAGGAEIEMDVAFEIGRQGALEQQPAEP